VISGGGYREPRLTPARADVAAASLKGIIQAPRYAEGHTRKIARGFAGLRKAPDDSAGLHTQLLFGDRFTVYDEQHGWTWGQAERDSYVGYLRADALTEDAASPTHWVTALGTPLLSGAQVRTAAREILPMNAQVTVVESDGRFARLAEGGYVFGGHLAPLSEHPGDWVGVAERYVGAPYVWGGKSAAGIDCSGLIQNALQAAGMAAPRDTDMMEAALGVSVPFAGDLGGLARGDLIFWQGHVGVMQDGDRLLHANAWFMDVTSERLADAAERILRMEGPIRSVKRLARA
jgi:cell wall-associated NlpC family hydrolase